jgi:hypothetical protein
VPQTAEDREFALRDLADGCKEGIYERMARADMERVRKNGNLGSSAFTHWQGKGEERKPRLVVNFYRQSKFWRKHGLRMETAGGFMELLKEGDRLLSFDVKAGYRHQRLHPTMLDHFVFSYEGAYYRCLALPFRWGPSAYHFTRFMLPFVR